MYLGSTQPSVIQFCYGSINDIEVLCTLSTSGSHDTACAPIKSGEVLKVINVSTNALTKWYFKSLETS